MSKFIKEFENGIIKNTLIFRDKIFTLTMIPNEENSGSASAEICFSD